MSKFCLIFFLTVVAVISAQVSSVDSGVASRVIAEWDKASLREWGVVNPWVRIHPKADPNNPTEDDEVASEKSSLSQLAGLGFKSILFLHWNPTTWELGVRKGSRMKVPLDLREAYRRGFAYGQTYGSVTGGFEVENEPDISFVGENAETYLAFQKAVYLGLKRGAAKSKDEVRGKEGEDKSSHPLGQDSPLIVMAPLALPPGPYFEQLVENGLFSYTDAFNYHYYGYAEDFSGVYRQFADAVRELEDRRSEIGDRDSEQGKGGHVGNPNSELQTLTSVKKTLPILLTEYGYGSLGHPDRNTVEGRVRQWRWFKSVGEQIHRLKIAGPMAFYLQPYFEREVMEFGLTVRSEERAISDHVERGLRTPPNDFEKARGGDPALQFTAGGLSYKPSDFGLTYAEPWMDQIGLRFGANEATPALAWLYDYGLRNSYQPRDWTVSAPPPSEVVIDFIAGAGLVQMKRYGGYIAMRDMLDGRPVESQNQDEGNTKEAGASGVEIGASGRNEKNEAPLPFTHVRKPLKSGTGHLVIYNFSSEVMLGRLEIVEGRELVVDPEALMVERTLEPMGRLVIPVDVRVSAQSFRKHRLQLRFKGVAAMSRTPNSELPSSITKVSLFSTTFYPDGTGMKETVLEDFGGEKSDRIGENQALLEKRPLAIEEPELISVGGRWRATRGVEIEDDSKGNWRFAVTAFPKEPKKTAMAELPLPDDFEFPDGGMMRMHYRLAVAQGLGSREGEYFELYFRTANGNLYQVWPRQYAKSAWRGYTELKENYTMAFYGRANLPWRFRDNRPIALVFIFRPVSLPASYEVKNARIVKLETVALE